MRTERDREASVEEVVADLCANLSSDGLAPAGPEATLAELGLDSLGCADLAIAVEERFGIRLADGQDPTILTVGDVVALVSGGHRPRPRVPDGIGRLQGFAKGAAGWAFRWQTRLKVAGADHVPPRGPVILAANHRSMMDVPVMVLACPRPVVFMAKQELFTDGFRRWAFHNLGGFPVRRDAADVRATDIALAVLERGQVLGLYPEGTRSRTGEMLPLLHGAAWLALRTGAPIVPCGLRGTANVAGGLRRDVQVTFDPAIVVEREPNAKARKAKAAALTEQLLTALTSLTE
jgi:1-acyl-sn-glycerol-3-phosphate acyltransferase